MSSLADPRPVGSGSTLRDNWDVWAGAMADAMLRQHPVSAMRWRYEDGFLVRAIGELGRHTGAACYTQAVFDYVARWVQPDGSIDGYQISEYNLDQVMPGRLLFGVYEVTGAQSHRQAIELLREQLRWQPRTRSGGFWHKLIYPYQMWLDGIYMASPFLAQYAVAFDEPAALGDVARQVILLGRQTRDPATGLLYHAWDESRRQAWRHPDTGCSPHFWGRAIGWYVMAIVDILDFLPADHPQAAPLIAILHDTLAALLDARDGETGLWRLLLDQGPRPGNYLEASSACMYVYALAKGARMGYLPAAWRDIAEASGRQILARFIAEDPSGEFSLQWTCGTAGLGGVPYRDGSYEYYVSEPVVTNDPKGVAPFILAAIELARAAETQM